MKLKILSVFIACITQCSIMWAGSADGTIVYLHSKHTPKLGGNMGPSKAPAKRQLTVSAYLDEAMRNLEFHNSSEEIVSYYIYNDNGEEVIFGNISFIENSNASIYIGMLEEGIYTINIVSNGVTYEGIFQL